MRSQPVCGEFGRVWADGALRLPNVELLAGPGCEWIRNASGGHLTDGSTERCQSAREKARAALNWDDVLWANTHVAGCIAPALGSRPVAVTPLR